MEKNTRELLASLEALNHLLKDFIGTLEVGENQADNSALVPLAQDFLDHAELDYQHLIDQLNERMN